MSGSSVSMSAFGICSIFMVMGPALIMLNQYILKSLNFPYPMALSGMGVLASGIFARVLVSLGYVQIQRSEAIEGHLWYRRVLPVGMASAGTLAFGNMVYLHLDVGFIQMLKSFTPVIIMMVGYLARIEHVTTSVVVSVLIISLGTAATCSFTPELNLLGIFIMFMSELMEGIRLVITQYFLQQLKFGVTEGQYVLAPACAFWLFLASLIFEVPDMIEKGAINVVLQYPFHFLCAASMGIGVNFISYYVIQYTSSLTMKILATVRNICLVILGVMWYKEIVTINQAWGYFIALVGFACYNMSKMGYFENNSMLMVEVRKLMYPQSKALLKGDEESGLLLGKP